MSIKSKITEFLTEGKAVTKALSDWFTKDDTTDISYDGKTIPSRAKYLKLHKPKDGKDGKDGTDGKDGKDGAVSAGDIGHGHDQIPKTDADFKTKFTRAVGTVGGKLPITLFILTSGYFFVRNADGSLPSGIDNNKVWSLADQKLFHGGQPTVGFIHIELPVGLVKFSVAGGGGGGGAYHVLDGNGARGGQSAAFGLNAYGGAGGWSSWRSTNRAYTQDNGGGHGGNVIVGGGGIGGSSLRSTGSSYGGGLSGRNGGLVWEYKYLTAGQTDFFYIGAGGAHGGSGSGYGSPENGESGYIIVEYI